MSTAYDSFLGREVRVTSETKELEILGKVMSFTNHDLAADDVVIAEIEALHPNVRLWLPGTFGTMDYRTDRLNVHVEETSEGVFTITEISVG